MSLKIPCSRMSKFGYALGVRRFCKGGGRPLREGRGRGCSSQSGTSARYPALTTPSEGAQS